MEMDLLKPSGYSMYYQVYDLEILRAAQGGYLCVSYEFTNR
jgi:hypothetical protein